MDKGHQSLVQQITDNSILFVAVMGVPINIITFFALRESQYQWPRYVPVILEGIACLGAFKRKVIPLPTKLWGFIALLFTVGCYNLLLGLIDMASLWFVLAIMYTLFIAERREALYVFLASFLAVLVTGILLMTKTTFIPLQYNFENCQFACVAVRIIHFLMVGMLTYYILDTFFREIRKHLEALSLQSEVLEKANRALDNEMREKKLVQQRAMEAIMTTEEKERRRFAADLHDGLGPSLSSINLFFQAYIDAQDPDSRQSIAERLKTAIHSAITDVSRVAHSISPHVLEKFGLGKALESFVAGISAGGQRSIELVCDSIERFDHKRELALYRTLTELINNTVKHAGVTDIGIRCTIERGTVLVDYRDSGCGFPIEKLETCGSGMGLANMKNRIQSLGGTIALQSAPACGMTAQIRLPMQDDPTS